MSRVLLTGAGGFIGAHTVGPLLRAGHDVHAISRNPPVGGISSAPDRVVWHTLDLTDPIAAPKLIREIGADSLIHLAWYVEHGSYWRSSENLVWVEATLRLLRAFAAAGGRRAVLAGTCAEYEWAASRGVYDEGDTPLVPATLYGAAKHATYVVAERFAETEDFSLAWGRIFMPYGPGEVGARLVPSVAQALLAGYEARVSDGSQVRDFMYVQDVACAFAALLDSEVQGAVNVASGRSCTIREMVSAIADEIGAAELVRWGAVPTREGEPPALVADVRRLREEVGFVPAVDLQEGARRTVDWWREAASP